MKMELLKQKISRHFLAKIFVLVFISYIYLYRSFHSFTNPYVVGDGFEYILMTEAYQNHFSPDVTLDDINSFKEKFSKAHSWQDFYKKGYVESLIADFKKSKGEFKETTSGFYVCKHGTWYSYHFSFYSLVNLPVYILARHHGPLRPFYITNAILVLVTSIFILFFTPFSFFKQILAALCFCFSACYWYLSWQHTEVFTACFVTAAMILFFNKKYYWSLFVLALICMQTQPLTLLLGFVGLVTILENGINKRNIIKVVLLGSIALLPSLFYYIHYGTTNLIKDAGFLDTKFITLNRVSGFYFDFNQGLIITIPIILLMYIPLLISEAVNVLRKKTKLELSLLLPLCIIAISITISTMGNWNHGMAIINRYASWMSCIIMVHVFYLTDKLSDIRSAVLFNYYFMFQFFTTLYHQRINKLDWSQYQHTPLAHWFLVNYPNYYSPDPTIFMGRTLPYTGFVEENSPVIFFDDKKIKKVMVCENRLADLEKFGFTKETIEVIRKKVKFNYGWGYLDEYFVTSKTDEEIYSIIKERKIQAAIGKILASPEWSAQIEKKAKEWNIPYEQVLRMDGQYVVDLDEKAQKEAGK